MSDYSHICPDLSEFEGFDSVLDQIEGATADFWGDDTPRQYPQDWRTGNLCPECLRLNIRTPIADGSHFCREHAMQERVKRAGQVKRLRKLARRHRLESVDAIALSLVPAWARVEEER